MKQLTGTEMEWQDLTLYNRKFVLQVLERHTYRPPTRKLFVPLIYDECVIDSLEINYNSHNEICSAVYIRRRFTNDTEIVTDYITIPTEEYGNNTKTEPST